MAITRKLGSQPVKLKRKPSLQSSKLGKTLKTFVKKREVRRNTKPTMRAFTSKATKIGKSKTTKLKMGVKKKVIRQKTLVRAMRRGSRRNY